MRRLYELALRDTGKKELTSNRKILLAEPGSVRGGHWLQPNSSEVGQKRSIYIKITGNSQRYPSASEKEHLWYQF